MRKNILIIGGTRFFGPLLVEKLLEAEHRVTIATRGLTSDVFGERVERIFVDRRNLLSMTDAFAECHFDLVYDQLCYSPEDARIADKVFSGRVDRYVMASTIETYDQLGCITDQPFHESLLDLEKIQIDFDYPWLNPEYAEVSYAKGKRQSEAYFYQRSDLPVVSIRIGHVLSGTDDFTGRLAFYVEKALSGEQLQYSSTVSQSSFLNPNEIAKFLVWVGEQSFIGPINAASHGCLSSKDIIDRVSRVLDISISTSETQRKVKPSELSPFDFPVNHAMDTSRAQSLGYHFTHIDDWLDILVKQHAKAKQ